MDGATVSAAAVAAAAAAMVAAVIGRLVCQRSASATRKCCSAPGSSNGRERSGSRWRIVSQRRAIITLSALHGTSRTTKAAGPAGKEC